MQNFSDTDRQIIYYWRPIVSRWYLMFLWCSISIWLGMCIELPILADAPHPTLFILIPLVVALVAKAFPFSQATHRAITITNDKLVVHTFKGDFDILFKDVTHIRYRNGLSEILMVMWFFSTWGWERGSIQLRTRNRFDVFYVPAGRAVNALPQRLLEQIKTRVRLAGGEPE